MACKEQHLAVAIIAAVSILAACASMPKVSQTGIVEADENMVANCQFLGTLSQAAGRTRHPHLLPTTGAMDDAMEVARGRLFDKAKKLGATHVVLVSASNPSFLANGTLVGRAYRCTAN